MKRRYRKLGDYGRVLPGEDPANMPPPRVVNVRVTLAEHRRLTWLAATDRPGRRRAFRARLRARLARILGRETMDLIEAGARPGEPTLVRLILKVGRSVP